LTTITLHDILYLIWTEGWQQCN